MAVYKYYIFIFLILFVIGCDKSSRNIQYNPKKYDNYQISRKQDSTLLHIINFFNQKSFEGRFGFRNGSVVFGYVKGDKIIIPMDFQNKLKKYHFEDGVIHINNYTYFKIDVGFIDDNCGIMYVPVGESMPVQVTKSRCLKNSSFGHGSWYFVETKL